MRSGTVTWAAAARAWGNRVDPRRVLQIGPIWRVDLGARVMRRASRGSRSATRETESCGMLVRGAAAPDIERNSANAHAGLAECPCRRLAMILPAPWTW